MRTIIATLTAFLLSLTAAHAVWSGNVQIVDIEVSEVFTNGVWVRFNPNPFPNHTCSEKNGQFLLVAPNATVLNHMISTTALALVHSRPVLAYSASNSSCSTGTGGGYPILKGITIK